ncbi:MAG TPA: hypothetical protein PKA88_16685 [Polyangiaceae bacterium]|nr:hypothetical protein [Polyangiaceae bacterium]
MKSNRARRLAAAAAMLALLASCDQTDAPAKHDLPNPASAPSKTPAIQSAVSIPAPAVSSAADLSNATDAAATKRDPKHRDKDLKRCCGMFGPYATGFVANKGPNLVKTEFLCIDLWKQGYTLADAEEKIRKSALGQRSYMPKFCESKYVAWRRNKQSDAG